MIIRVQNQEEKSSAIRNKQRDLHLIAVKAAWTGRWSKCGGMDDAPQTFLFPFAPPETSASIPKGAERRAGKRTPKGVNFLRAGSVSVSPWQQELWVDPHLWIEAVTWINKWCGLHWQTAETNLQPNSGFMCSLRLWFVKLHHLEAAEGEPSQYSAARSSERCLIS